MTVLNFVIINGQMIRIGVAQGFATLEFATISGKPCGILGFVESRGADPSHGR